MAYKDYNYDRYANNPDNLIQDEVHLVDVSVDRSVFLEHGAFYDDQNGLVVASATSSIELIDMGDRVKGTPKASAARAAYQDGRWARQAPAARKKVLFRRVGRGKKSNIEAMYHLRPAATIQGGYNPMRGGRIRVRKWFTPTFNRNMIKALKTARMR